MEADWDLHAVVRGCTAAAATISPLCSIKPRQQSEDLLCSRDYLLNSLNSSRSDDTTTCGGVFNEDLHELYRPFLRYPSPPSEQPLPAAQSDLQPISAALRELQDSHPIQPQLNINTAAITSNFRAQTSTSKRRKNQMKRLCQVAAEDLNSDTWSWRKYGQKPIKGSPYPRGYYRCSTSKGCLARKQVERNRSDPNMFIVTYTAEHNHPMPTHRNSLAGITRQKAATGPQTTIEANKSSGSPPEKQESSREEKDDVFEDEVLDDDFIEGLAELVTPNDTGDSFSDNFPATMQLHICSQTPPAVVDLLDSI